MAFRRSGIWWRSICICLSRQDGLAAVAIFVLAGLSFAPVKFLHPLRVQHWRMFNIAILTIWAVLALAAVVQDLSPGPYVTVPLALIAVYFFAVGLLPDRVRSAA